MIYFLIILGVFSIYLVRESLSEVNIKVHFFYVTFILGSIVIFLATIKSTEQPNFTEYLSTAATLTSLVLGLLAIIYAFISTDSVSKTTGKLVDSVNESKEASGNLVAVIDQVKKIADSSGENSEVFTKLIAKLTTEVRELSDTARSLGESTNEMASILPSIPSEMEALGKRIEEINIKNGEAVDINRRQVIAKVFDDKVLLGLMGKASPFGRFMIYICYLSKKSGKSFSFSKDFFGVGRDDYFFGFYVCLVSCGFVAHDKSHSQKMLYKVVDCPELFVRAKDKFIESINKAQSQEIKDRWSGAILKAEAFFGVD